MSEIKLNIPAIRTYCQFYHMQLVDSTDCASVYEWYEQMKIVQQTNP